MGEDTDLNDKEKKELALAEIVLIALAIVGVAVVVWLAWIRPAQRSRGVNSFETCAKAGNPIQLSSPEVCVTKDGKRFVAPK